MRGGVESRDDIPEKECLAVLIPSKRTSRQIEGVVSNVNIEVISRCSIGRYSFPISNTDLTEALGLEKVGGVRVIRIYWSLVLHIVDELEVRQRVMERGVLSNGFDRMVDWNERESSMLNRKVWISVFGVPIHAWASSTFERLVAH
ncbi:hypothetical protein V6N11_075626 [Hibiscus sabdariffa]|uniref:DUF4283 domain-containing protein n=1 Tax=Hibiscus sabdariffa TaxID=183260 RepID=A0ABR2R740_9ROSI